MMSSHPLFLPVLSSFPFHCALQALINGRHVNNTSVCVSLRWSEGLRMVRLPAGAAKKNTSHGNEMKPQGTTHLIQRPCYQRGSLCQDPASNRTTRRSDDRKRRKLQWYGHVSRSSGLAKTILQGTATGGRRQGGQRKRWETTSGNGQAWNSLSPRGQWRTEENRRNWS